MIRALAVTAALAGVASPASCQSASTPRLVVVLTVDQLSPEYFERFGPQLTGGLARITRNGVYYPGGLQDHAMTETAPGHSTLLSGRSPASTGILSNELGVPDTWHPMVGASGTGASPFRFRGTTLADWMLARDPMLQILSVSRKDRGAILPIGRMVAPVFWFAGSTGTFTTSSWYTRTLPDWLTAWNARGGVNKLAGYTWNLLLPESEYPEPDAQPWERAGRGNTFPYQLPSEPPSLYTAIQSVPWIDSLTLDVALEGVRSMGMGRRSQPDLLAVSLSATDAVGHTWGPRSREIRDHVIRIDRWVGTFLDSLDVMVGRGRVLVVLSADHGIQPYPEGLVAEGQPAGRSSVSALIRAVDSTLASRYHTDFGVGTSSGLIFADVNEMRARGVNTDSLSDALAERVRALRGVRQVFTPRTLASAPASDTEAGRWRRQIHNRVEWLVAASLEPNWMWGSAANSTNHGTTNHGDMNVPIAFMGAGISAQVSTRAARTIDIGTTLAALLGVRPLEAVEGTVLPEVVGNRR